jgi:hypothetical protein
LVTQFPKKVASKDLENRDIYLRHLLAPVSETFGRRPEEAALPLEPAAPPDSLFDIRARPLVKPEHYRIEGQLDELADRPHDGLGIIDKVLIADFVITERAKGSTRFSSGFYTPLPKQRPLDGIVGSPFLFKERKGHVTTVSDDVNESRLRKELGDLWKIEHVSRCLVAIPWFA